MMTNDDLVFRMIPAVLDYALDTDNSDMISAMVDKEFWKGFAESTHGQDVAVDWDQFAVEEVDYNDEWVAIAFHFPEPQQMPEAAFGAIFLHKEGRGTKYFTLEKSSGEHWALCAPGMKQHQFCQLCLERPSYREFLALVADYCTKWVESF